MNKYNIDVCRVCQTHLTVSNTEMIEGWLLLNSGMDDIHRHGVGFLFSPRARASLMSDKAKDTESEALNKTGKDLNHCKDTETFQLKMQRMM